MKKVLILASCSIILALIIGATGKVKTPSLELEFNTKCKETPKSHTSECAGVRIIKQEIIAEKFLRGIKYKSRIAYA